MRQAGESLANTARTSIGYAALSAGVLGLLEGLVWGWAAQSPEDVVYRPLKCGVWAASTWALLASVCLIPLWLIVGVLLRRSPKAAGYSAALGVAWTAVLIGGLSLNREALPRLLSPVSLACNAGLVAAAALFVWLAGGRWEPARVRKVARIGWWVLGMAALCYVVVGRFEREERIALSLRRYARAHTSEGKDFLRKRAATEAGIDPLLPRNTNVLLILMDALRPSNMGCYGYQRNTTPYADKLARSGVVFDNAYCAKTSTSPSCASMLTGVYPHTHGIIRFARWLDDSLVTLAECLRANGFSTAEIANNSNVSDTYNFTQGFDSAEFPSPWDATRLTDAAVQRLDKLAAQPKPWFLYLHYIEPHEPFKPPPPFHRMFVGDALYNQFGEMRVPILDSPHAHGHIRAKHAIGDSPDEQTDPDYYVAEYDASIRYAQEQVGRVLRKVRQIGEYEDTLIIFLADHGESFGQHNWWFEHGSTAYEEVARIPLIFSHPRLKPHRVKKIVDNVSVTPTVLDLLGLPKPKDIEGPSLAGLIGGQTSENTGLAFVEGRLHPPLSRAVIMDEWKLIWNWQPCSMRQAWSLSMLRHPNKRPKLWHLAWLRRQTPVWELYHLRTDPTEQHNVIEQHPGVAKELKDLLFAWIACAPRDDREWAQKHEKPLTNEAIEQLRSLGYIQ